MKTIEIFNHSHYLIEDCILYECYKTIRGIRYAVVCTVLFPDTDPLNLDQLKQINSIIQFKKQLEND